MSRKIKDATFNRKIYYKKILRSCYSSNKTNNTLLLVFFLMIFNIKKYRKNKEANYLWYGNTCFLNNNLFRNNK